MSLIEKDFKEHEHKMPEVKLKEDGPATASEAWPKISEETVYIDKKHKANDKERASGNENEIWPKNSQETVFIDTGEKEKVIEKVYCSQTNDQIIFCL